MILSLDVGFASCGWSVLKKGVVVDCGTIISEKSKKKSTRTADDYYERSGRIASELKAIVERHGVQGIVGELPSGGAQSAKAMAMMNMATAIVASVAACLGIPCEWCTPNDVKLAVCAFRSATKDDMMSAIREKFKGKGDHLFASTKCGFEHVADSLGAYMALSGGNIVRIYG